MVPKFSLTRFFQTKLLALLACSILIFFLLSRELKQPEKYKQRPDIQNLSVRFILEQNSIRGLKKEYEPSRELLKIRPKSNPYHKILDNLERLVHLDLKGAPPKIDYLKKFLPFIKQHGATGILLEYEDMFPFDGNLNETRHGNAYSLEDIATIKQLAKENQLTIMPLVQTYGHLEWLLKVKKFAHLREDARFPQVITPCLDESYTVLFDMLDQVIKQHPDVPYFHIGCDEVYYKLVHQSCTHDNFSMGFMEHLIKVATFVKSRLPNAKILFWDDMLHGMNLPDLLLYKQQLKMLEIETMMWGYMGNVRQYFDPSIFDKYGKIFGKIWIATAYKGASGVLNQLTSINTRYENHMGWLGVMLEKHDENLLNFSGVALTGWSRYDHFLGLCDLLPQAIPALVVCLKTLQHGPLTHKNYFDIIRHDLGCTRGIIPWSYQEQIGLYMRRGFNCSFPGQEVFEAILELKALIFFYDNLMEKAQTHMTKMNLDFSYIHKANLLEHVSQFVNIHRQMNSSMIEFLREADSIYSKDTGREWIYTYVAPYLDKLQEIQNLAHRLVGVEHWLPRPLPISLNNYIKSSQRLE